MDNTTVDNVPETNLDLKKQVQPALKVKTPPPEVPHITLNYASLSQITANVVQHTYSELLNLIETLPSVGSDLARKRRLLDFFIKSRQEFVKLYVLVKWAKLSPEISKCIDVVAWLGGQQNCYGNVVNMLFNIERTLGGAKLRNPDVETALEVLRSGEPYQQSRQYIAKKPLSTRSVLKTLTNLNVLLSIRLALTEELPPQYRNYHIGNGRVKFTVEHCFSADLGIADDTVDARFFLVDFAFCFDGAKAISLGVRNRVEHSVNEMLATKKLAEVFDWMLRFSQNYKLTVIHERLNDLEVGLWANVLRHAFNPEKSVVSVYYWINRPGPKSVIEIGLFKSTQRIGIRWLRDGHVVKGHNIDFGQHVSAEWLIGEVTKQHIHYIVESVYNDLIKELNVDASTTDQVLIQGENKIRIQLTASKHTVFAIDTQTGRAVLQSSALIVHEAEQQLNELTDRTKCAAVLIRLRTLCIQQEITSRATATGWIACTSVYVSSEDQRKHFSYDTKSVFALRIPTWSLKWFLVVSIGQSGTPKWHISQLEYKNSAWAIDFIEPIQLGGDSYDYKVFDSLSTFATARISVNSLARKLQARHVRYHLVRSETPAPTVVIDVNSLLKSDSTSSSNNAGLGITGGSLLVIKVFQERIIAQGKMRNSSVLESVPTTEEVAVDRTSGTFALTVQHSTEDVLDILISKLWQIDRVVSYVELIKSSSLRLISSSMTEIRFEYGREPQNYRATVELSATGRHNLVLADSSPHNEVLPLLSEILHAHGLKSVIWLLRSTLPLYEALRNLRQHMGTGRAGVLIIPRNVTEIKVAFPVYDISLDVQVKIQNRHKVCVFVTDIEDLPITPGVKLKPEHKQSSTMLSQLWAQKNEVEGIIPLVYGASAQIEAVGKLFEQIRDRLMDNTVSIE